MGGSFTIDMNSIENHNIEESGMRQVLVDHLKSDDFFHVERYPEAVFQIKTIVAIPGAAAGGLNYKIVGTLQLKDATNELELAAWTRRVASWRRHISILIGRCGMWCTAPAGFLKSSACIW